MRAVRGEAPVPVSGEDGAAAVQVAFRIMEALQECGWTDAD